MPSREDPDAAGSLGFDQAVAVADEPAACEPWRADFDASADWVRQDDLRVPDDGELVALCTTFGFPDVAVRRLTDQRRTWDDPRFRRLGAHVQWMITNRYTPTGYHRLGWPTVFSRCPLFYAYAALGLARRVVSEQSDRGIDPDVTRTTLRDIGQQVYLHDRVYGQAGMNKGWWLCHHLSHHLYRLGRLQFQRGRSRRALGPVPPEAPFLDVHIPEDGPLDPGACDAAFAQAAPFFARHFPDENVRFLVCSSWLLDPVLEKLLPAASNIVAFQRRFERHELKEGSSSVFEFVFDRPDLDRMQVPDVSVLPRDTQLRAAIVDRYARGGAIRMGVGTIPL